MTLLEPMASGITGAVDYGFSITCPTCNKRHDTYCNVCQQASTECVSCHEQSPEHQQLIKQRKLNARKLTRENHKKLKIGAKP